MAKIIKKGLDVITHADGSITYKPYAIMECGWFNDKYYVSAYNGIYFLNEKGFVERDSEKGAIAVLDEAVGRYEKEENRKRDSKIVSVIHKEIK